MIRRIIGSSVKARRAVAVAGIGVMVFGAMQLRSADLESLPEFDPPTVKVQTDALGLSAEEVEQFVTVPIEQDLLDGVAWLDKIHSKSVPGLSYIEMTFKPGTNIYRARQVVQERISQAAGLPNVSRPPQMLQPQSSTSRTEMIALSSKTLTPIQIGVLARWTIRPRLLAIPGVSNVAIWGQRERQLQVLVDPAKLRDKKVTLEQLVSTTGNALWVSPLTFLEASTPGTGGFIDTPSQRLGIQHNLPILQPSDLSKIAIDEAATTGLTLGDVATVVEDHQPLIGDAVVGGNGTYLMVVDKLPNANTADVTSAVESALSDLRPALGGLVLDTSVFRPQTYVHTMSNHLRRTAMLSFAALAVVALIFVGWRATVVVVASVALSLAAAATVLEALERPFNQFVFAGLAVALIAVVDDAVVQVLDGVRRQQAEVGSEGKAGRFRQRIAIDAASSTAPTALWSLVIFAVAVTPVFLMNGVAGDAFFPPAAFAALVALVASLIVSITVTPALGALVLGSAPSRESAILRMLSSASVKIVSIATKRAIPAFAAMAIMIVAVAFVGPQFRKVLLPTFKDPNVLIRWQAPYGTSLPEMGRIMGRATAEIRTLPDVQAVGTQIGQAILGDQPVGSDSAEMWVSLKPNVDNSRAVQRLKRVVAGYPGIDHSVTTYSRERLRGALGRTSDEVTVRIFGQDFGVLKKKANEVTKLIGGIKGIKNAKVATQQAEPTIQVEVDLAKAQKLGIKPGDVRRASATLLSGLRVGNLFQDQKIFDVTVWGEPNSRRSVTSVKDLLIDTPAGNVIRLGEVANVIVRSTAPIIEHQDVSRFIDIRANVSGDVGSARRHVRDRLKTIVFPYEYHGELLGDYADEQNSQRRIAGFAIGAAVAVFLLLQAASGSWRLAAIGFPTVVLPLSGGLIAARIYDRQMTLATVVGLLAVLLLAIRTTVQYTDRYLQLRKLGEPPGAGSAALAARGQVQSTVATVLVTAIVFVPVLVFGSTAGQELLCPMAVVIEGGLLTLLLTALIVLPGLTARFAPAVLTRPVHLDLARDTGHHIEQPIFTALSAAVAVPHTGEAQ